MHEWKLIQGLVTDALERLAAAGGSRVTGLEVVLGHGGHLDEESAREQFALATRGTPAEGARVTLSWVPARYRCFECTLQFPSEAPAGRVRCPSCGGVALPIEREELIYLRAIEMEGGSECA